MERVWYVLHVKPRAEKVVFRYLEEYGFWRYLPLYAKVRRVQRRKVRTMLPLFPGYVFAKLDPGERTRMLQTNHIVRTIPADRPRELIHQLRQVARAARNTEELKKLSVLYKTGDRVRVVLGPMRGTEGYVKYDGESAKVRLNVDILGACVEVSVPPDALEKI